MIIQAFFRTKAHKSVLGRDICKEIQRTESVNTALGLVPDGSRKDMLYTVVSSVLLIFGFLFMPMIVPISINIPDVKS